MRKLLNHKILLLLAFFAVGSFTSCEEEAPLVYNGPSEVHFPSAAATYFVNQENDGGFKIPIGVTAASNESRTFNVALVVEEESAVPYAEDGTHYTLESTTVTIPANEVTGYITVNGNFENLADPRKLSFVLSEGQKNAGFRQSYELVMRQFCPYVQSDFVGEFRLTSALFGEWDVEMVAGENPDEVIVKDMYEEGYDVIIKLDDSNQSNFVATVAEQGLYTHSIYGEVSGVTEAAGKFSACETTIDVRLFRCVSIGCFGARDEVNLRKL